MRREFISLLGGAPGTASLSGQYFWLHLAWVRPTEWQHLSCRQPAFRGEKLRRPCVECGTLLLCPVVPLINPHHASPASAQMVQHRLGDLEAHAEAL